jgi:hypothetical protein
MNKLLSLTALLPAAAGLWFEQREAARTLAVVEGMESGWQRARITAFGFDDGVRYATFGLGISAALLFGLGLVVLVRWLAEPRASRQNGSASIPALLIAALGLAASAWYSAALGRAFSAASQEKLAPQQTADVLVAALDFAAVARWSSWLVLVAMAGVVVFAIWQRRRDAAGAWAIVLFGVGVVVLSQWQARAVVARRSALEALANGYYPRDVQLVDAPFANFARRANGSVLWVGAQHVYFAELGAKPREIAPPNLLVLPYCVERLKEALAEFQPLLWERSSSAIALDAGTSRAGLLCVIRALQRPIARPVELDSRGRPEEFELPELDWLVRADARPLAPPFDVIGIEFGAVRFAVQRSERPGQTVIAFGDARKVLRGAAGVRDAVLVIESPGPSNGLGLNEEFPLTQHADALPPTTTPAPSALGSVGVPTTKLDLRFGPPRVEGQLDEKLLRAQVTKLGPRFEACYGERAIVNPNLEGRISARFIVDRDGAVTNVSNAGSDFPDSRGIRCVLDVFYALQFPPSPSGIVTVIFPLRFEPRGK